MNTPASTDLIIAADLPALYVLLGAQLLGEGLGAGATDPDEKSRYGKNWLEERRDRLRARLCGEPLVAAMGDDLASDMLAVAVIVYSIAEHDELLALTIAAIVVRRGIKAFCA